MLPATSATASSKPFGLFQDSAESGKCQREATSQYALRPRSKPRITQAAVSGRGQGVQKPVVAEKAPSACPDASTSVAHSAGSSAYCQRNKRNDLEEQAELVDVMNMLTQLYRDQAESFEAHCEILNSMGGLRAIEDQCRTYAMDDDNPLQIQLRKSLLRLQMEMTLSEKASRQQLLPE